MSGKGPSSHKADRLSASRVTGLLLRGMREILEEISNVDISRPHRSRLEATFARLEGEALIQSQSMVCGAGDLYLRDIVKSGSFRMIQRIPVPEAPMSVDWPGNLVTLIQTRGLPYLEEIDKRFTFNSCAIRQIMLQAEHDRTWLPLLERHALSPLMKREFKVMWFPYGDRNSISKVFAAAPAIAPRLFKRQTEAWPNSANELSQHMIHEAHPPTLACLDATGLLFGDEDHGPVNEHKRTSLICPDGTAHEKLEVLAAIDRYRHAAQTKWNTEA